MTTAYLPDAWETFAAANAGAAAALAGLLFVGISINISTIVQSRRLIGRSLEAFTLLSGTLVVSVLVLVPAITTTGLGIALVVAGFVIWAVVTYQHLRSLPRLGGETDVNAPPGSTTARIVFGQLATVPLILAGVTLTADTGGGLYWLVPAIVFAYVAALLNAWVLLIEILR